MTSKSNYFRWSCLLQIQQFDSDWVIISPLTHCWKILTLVVFWTTTKRKQSETKKIIDTVIVVWIVEFIPKQAILEAIEQIIMDSVEFERVDIDQVELLTKRLIFKPKKNRQ